jgi:hypothetical protein
VHKLNHTFLPAQSDEMTFRSHHFRREPNPKTVQTAFIALALSLLLFASSSAKAAFAQSTSTVTGAQSDQAQSHESDDLVGINQTVEEFFNIISAAPGTKLDRERLGSLFVPGGRIATARPPKGNTPAQVYIMTPDEYADGSDRFTAKYGFFDHILHNRVEKFGLMAHVYSAYESRNNPGDATPMARGIKSIDLLHSDGKWLLVQVFWDSERPGSPIPQEYLR